MLFSSTLFLFAFLPVVLTASFLIRGTKNQNALLLGASLVFYAWGEQLYVSVLLASILANYFFGLWIASRRRLHNDRIALTIAVAANLVLLGVFKYANFTVNNLDDILSNLASRLYRSPRSTSQSVSHSSPFKPSLTWSTSTAKKQRPRERLLA